MNRFAGFSKGEREDFFVECGSRMGLSPQIVEKDFWVCWVLEKLFALQNTGPTLIFKGGTSLSKAFSLIKRFSEDIDISIDRASLGFAGADNDPEADAISNNERRRRIERLTCACQEKVSNDLLPILSGIFGSVLTNNTEWSLVIDESDPDKQTLLYYYPTAAKTGYETYIRPAVKIEMGARSDHWPSQIVRISAFVAQHFPDAFIVPLFEVKVLAPERTFWEKATLLHAEYHRPIEKTTPPRTSRHCYDLARLIEGRVGEKAMADEALLARVVQHKKIFFSSTWARYDEAKRGSLRVVPPASRMDALMEDYKSMAGMFFSDRVDFEVIIKILTDWETVFNQAGDARTS